MAEGGPGYSPEGADMYASNREESAKRSESELEEVMGQISERAESDPRNQQIMSHIHIERDHAIAGIGETRAGNPPAEGGAVRTLKSIEKIKQLAGQLK